MIFVCFHHFADGAPPSRTELLCSDVVARIRSFSLSEWWWCCVSDLDRGLQWRCFLVHVMVVSNILAVTSKVETLSPFLPIWCIYGSPRKIIIFSWTLALLMAVHQSWLFSFVFSTVWVMILCEGACCRSPFACWVSSQVSSLGSVWRWRKAFHHDCLSVFILDFVCV